MKATPQIIVLLILCALTGNALAQKNTNDSIYWDNGNISLLSDLGHIHILKKKGGSIKDARIYEIKKDKGILVYEKDKCLHDLVISNIDNIQPGYNPLAIMMFHIDNTPYIKALYKEYDSYNQPSNFKVVAKRAPASKQSKPARVIPAPTENLATDSVSASPYSNRLIDLDGNVWDIIIIIVQERVVEFKKMSNLDGPVYVKTFNQAQVIKNENYTTIKIIK